MAQGENLRGGASNADVPPASLRTLIVSDLRGLAALKDSRLKGLMSWADVLTLPGAWAAIVARTANHMNRVGLRPLSRMLYFANIVVFSADIQPGASIGPGLVMPHPVGVCIGSGVTLGANAHLMGLCRIGGGATDDPEQDGWPVIGDDIWMLDGAKIMGAITVGDRCVVACASTVLSSFPDGDVILVGSPARIGKSRVANATLDEPQRSLLVPLAGVSNGELAL